MSRRNLKRAVMLVLKESLTLGEGSEIDTTQGGRPHPRAGRLFVGVHGGSWTARVHNVECLDEEFEVLLTVSIRGTNIPTDRWGGQLLDAEDGLDFISRQIILVLHEQWDVINRANTLTENSAQYYIESSVSPFAEPLRFSGCSEPVDRDSSWWEGSNRTGTSKMEGVSNTLRFNGGRRLQVMSLAEKN